MSVSSIYNSQYYSNAALWNLEMDMKENGKTGSGASSTSASSSAAASSSSSGNGSAYGNNNSLISQLTAALSGVMDDMGLSANDKVTFQTISQYREKIQEQFTSAAKAGLKEAGVSDDAEFRLVMGSQGGIQVIISHEDKALIEQYFKDNPDMVTEFEKLQSLNKLEETRASRNIDRNAIRNRIQVESMTAWYSANSSFMSFTEQGAALYSGINTVA